jgi:predicted phage terminase large subunit-like protein
MNNEQKNELKKALQIELCRREFWAFCLFVDFDFFTNRKFLQEIAEAFQQVEEGRIKSLSVSMPPRAGKSYITSLFCAWTLGRNPSDSVMRNTCTATLYIKFSYDVRTIVKSDKFRIVFPEVRLSDDKANLQGWNTNYSKQVGYFGAGVGGTIIGFGATKVAITDDLYRGLEDALSDTVNDRILQWKQSTHDSRFESGCARIDIGTRWSLKDVIGVNIEQKIYEKSIIVSALTDKMESFCENVMTTNEYLEKKKRTNPDIWEAEYQQSPVDIQGRLFDNLNFISQQDFDEIKANNTIDGTLAYIDVADQGKDFTALAVCALINKQLYLIDYVFSRENTDTTLPKCAGKLNEHNTSYCRVESNSMGAMFSRQLQKLTPTTRILQVHNTTNKDTRIIMNSSYIQNKIIFVKTETPENHLFIENLVSYSKEGRNKNDDAPDCLAGLSIFIQSMFKNNL